MVKSYLKLTRTLYNQRYRLAYLGVFILIVVAFFYRLNTLTPGPHNKEVEYLAQVSDLGLSNIFDNIIFLPHLLLSKALTFVFGVSPLTIRLASVFFAFTMVAMLYGVLYIWHTRRIATVGLILLLSSSWLIGLARFATPDIMYAWGIMAAITALTMIFHHARHVTRRLVILGLSSFTLGLSLYIPYAIYIYLLAVIIAHRYILRLVDELDRRELVTIIVILSLTVLPLLVAIALDYTLVYDLVGLPASGVPPSTFIVLDHMQAMFSHIFWKSDGTLVTSLGNLPLLSIFGASLAALGMYHYEQHRSNIRTHLIVGLFFGMILLLALDYSPDKSATMMPLVFILISMGALTLLTQWYKIFPKNPFARTIGLGVMALFVAVSIGYNNQRYFVAWARSPETRISFSDDVVVSQHYFEGYLRDSGTPIKNVLLVMDQPELARFKVWLNRTIDATEFQAYNQLDASAQPEVVMASANVRRQKAHVDWKKYELVDEVETTSQVNPVVYRIYERLN